MIALTRSHTEGRTGARDSSDARPADLRARLVRCLARCSPQHPAALVHLDVAGAWDVKDAGGCAAIAALRETVASTLAGSLDGEVPIAAGGLCEFTVLLEGRHLARAREEILTVNDALDALCFTWKGHPFRLWAHAGVLELGADHASASHWLERAREACNAARDLAGEGIQVVEFNEHAWSDIARKREWAQHLSEIIG